MTPGEGRQWRAEILEAVMLWTVRLGAVLVAAAFASALFAERGLLHDPLFFLMLAGYAGVVGLWWGRALSYRARAAGFCAAVFAAGAAGLFSLGVLPGPVVVCAFVVIAARLFVGAGAMLGWLGVTTLVIVLAAHDGRGTVWPGARELGAWFLPRMAMGFALATASVAVIVAHVVDKLEASLRATSDALARLSATEAERERARAELAKTEAALLRSQKLEAMGRLAAGVGHDFNNTLQVVLSWVSVLRQDDDADTVSEGLGAIERAALHGRELTARLLELGRRDARARVRCSPVELVNDSVRSLRRLLPEDIAIELDADPAAPALFVEPAQLSHVLLNLGVNARDAMPAGGVLRIGVSCVPADGVPRFGVPLGAPRYVRLTVQDTGMGMDAETRAHAFEPFFTTKGDRGTGLGLATAFGVVKRNGGFIRLESELGKGTTFELFFPASEGVAEPERPTARPSARHGGRGLIMVAEDDDQVRQTMVRCLESAGYRVIATADAAGAIALVESRGPEVDLLCTDGIMPGGGTRRLIDRYLAARPDGHVIVCSGHVPEELLRRDLDAGAYGYLPKPFLTNELVERIEGMLAEH